MKQWSCFFGKIESIAKKLDGSEMKIISDYRKILKVQKAAPEDWKAYFDGLRANDTVMKDWEGFKTKMLAEEAHRDSMEEESEEESAEVTMRTFNTERTKFEGQ